MIFRGEGWNVTKMANQIMKVMFAKIVASQIKMIMQQTNFQIFYSYSIIFVLVIINLFLCLLQNLRTFFILFQFLRELNSFCLNVLNESVVWNRLVKFNTQSFLVVLQRTLILVFSFEQSGFFFFEQNICKFLGAVQCCQY